MVNAKISSSFYRSQEVNDDNEESSSNDCSDDEADYCQVDEFNTYQNANITFGSPN